MSTVSASSRSDLDNAIEREILSFAASCDRAVTIAEAFEPTEVTLAILLDQVARLAVAATEVTSAGPLGFGQLATALSKHLRASLVDRATSFAPHLLVGGRIVDVEGDSQ